MKPKVFKPLPLFSHFFGEELGTSSSMVKSSHQELALAA